jgi:hypothetical protein
MSRPGHDPDAAGPGEPADPRVARLLRWYPRAWRERYGEEFLAVVEDSLDGRPPGWRLRLAVAGYGLRERGYQACRAGRQVLAGGLAALPAMIRFLRAGGRLKLRRRLSWAAGATVAAAAGVAWIVFLSGTSSLAPFSASPAYFSGLVVTVLALAVALDGWAGIAAVAGRRLDLAPRVLAAERFLGRVAVPAILILIGINVVWYSAREASEFWLIWGLWSFVRQGMGVAGELRADRSR